MSLAMRLYRGRTDFDFVGNRKRWFTISAVMLVLAIGSLAIRQLNLSVDFIGGTVVEVENVADASVADVRNALAPIGEANAKVQITSGIGAGGIRVQTAEFDDPARQEALVAVVAAVGGVSPEDASVESVGPTFGAQVAESAVRALLIFLIVVAAFISWRFEWRMAAAALAALFHDLLLTAGVYSLVGLEVTPSTVIAVLTILGYSLYDTVVVFDKIEEHIKDETERRTIVDIINVSMNQVLMRSVNTSLTSLLPVGSLLFVGSFLLGATTLREFALALFVGIAAGTYSSIFVASPLLAIWKSKESDWQTVEKRIARKERRSTEPDPEPIPTPVAESASPPPAAETPSVPPGITPRPPKKRRKRR